MRWIAVALCLVCSGCCDYKIQWDAHFQKYYVYSCGPMRYIVAGPYVTEDDARRRIKLLRDNPTHWIEATP